MKPISVSRTVVTDRVLTALLEGMITFSLPPGTELNEAALAEQLGVSKTPVRESLVRLREIGVVEQVGSRLLVIASSEENIKAAYDFRIAVEVGGLRLAAERATVDQLEHAREIAERSLKHAQAGSRKKFVDADREFHLHLGELCGCPPLTKQVQNAYLLVSILRERASPSTSIAVEAANTHIAVVEALTAGEATSAMSLMQRHIESARMDALLQQAQFASMDDTLDAQRRSVRDRRRS